jgi:adenosylcobinamide kinase/adenosylcobinamide-phosphate guanylyltransferase
MKRLLKEGKPMRALITGGARSGKSGFAERYAVRLGESGVYVATAQALDTEMERRIERHRIRRESSGFRWQTVEEPFRLAERLRELSDTGRGGADAPQRHPARRVVLVDCLTLWLSNRLLAAEQDLFGGPDGAEESSAPVVSDRTDRPGPDGGPFPREQDRLRYDTEAALWEQVERRLLNDIDELADAVERFEGTLLLVTNEVGDGVVPAYRLGRAYRDLAGTMNRRIADVCEQLFLVTAGVPVELKSVAFRLDEAGPYRG